MIPAPTLDGHRQLLARSLLAYGAFGLLQVGYRLACSWAHARQARTKLKETPSSHGHEGFMAFTLGLAKNLHRALDWRLEVCKGLPVCKNWGFPWSCMLGNIFINNPEGVRHILKDEFQKYSKAIPSLDPFIIYFNEFMGSGIFTVLHGLGSVDNGQRWLQMRKTSAQMFNRKNFNTLMQEVFVTKADALREWLEGFADAEPVDIQKGFFNFTMDSIMNIFFGEDVSSQTGDHNPYGQAFDEAHEALFVHTVNSLAFNTFAMTLLPWPFGGAHGLARKFHDFASPMYWRFRKALRILDAEAHRMVQNCRIDASLSQRRDLLALFLQAEEEHGYSEGFLKEMVLNLIIAGRDTTACALSWMFVELARNPAVQSRLRDEIDEKLPSDANLDMQTLAHGKLPYLHGVLYETLRLWPPVPFDSKMTYADDVLPDGTQVSKGITVVFSPYILARDGERYPDPLAFKPERWIPFSAPSPFEFPVFQAGPRICLGMDMAIFEAKVAAVQLLRHLEFDLAPGQRIGYGTKITMNVRNGDKDELLVCVRRRH
ncbi:unnamed protein product [Effrenium voratum]|uniref:Cytochrome P450 n=1 Tax=Effrenium voratum TaxID=2562239 RepID=A0AA36IXL6_9DINO|nr:unnamed protein product [Effrenium voratum]CAJ1454713.1 unnamed protein product [Effrenium voratum]